MNKSILAFAITALAGAHAGQVEQRPFSSYPISGNDKTGAAKAKRAAKKRRKDGTEKPNSSSH